MAGKRKASDQKNRSNKGRNKTAPVQPIAWPWVAAFCVTLLVIGYSGLPVVESAAQARALYQQLGAVQKEQDRLLEENSRLSIERSTIASLQQLEEIAANELDMQFPADIEWVAP